MHAELITIPTESCVLLGLARPNVPFPALLVKVVVSSLAAHDVDHVLGAALSGSRGEISLLPMPVDTFLCDMVDGIESNETESLDRIISDTSSLPSVASIGNMFMPNADPFLHTSTDCQIL